MVASNEIHASPAFGQHVRRRHLLAAARSTTSHRRQSVKSQIWNQLYCTVWLSSMLSVNGLERHDICSPSKACLGRDVMGN